MKASELEFLGKLWFFFACFVAWNSMTLLYGCFDPGKELDLPAIGAQSYTERVVIGMPLLGIGYGICWFLARVILRRAGRLVLEKSPDAGTLSDSFVQTAFWSLMLVPVFTICWMHFGVLHDIHFVSNQDSKIRLQGWEAYWPPREGRWHAEGVHQEDESHPTVAPAWTPLIYGTIAVLVVVSYLELIGRAIHLRWKQSRRQH